MKTLKISKEEMLKRVSFFKDLKPLPIQLDKNIPQDSYLSSYNNSITIESIKEAMEGRF